MQDRQMDRLVDLVCQPLHRVAGDRGQAADRRMAMRDLKKPRRQ